MARNPRPPHDSSGGNPPPRKPRSTKRQKTDLSIFLQYPLSTMNDEAFRAVCDQIRSLLAPRTDLEHRGIDVILWTFERVRKAYTARDQGIPGADHYLKSMLESFRSRQQTFDLLRQIIDSDPEAALARSSARPYLPLAIPPVQADAPPPPPTVEPEPDLGPHRETEDADEIDEIELAARDWRTRIAMVPSFDARWPVLDQFNLRVDDLLTMRDRGVPEDEILEQYPGLTYSDLASCYSCEADGYRGPLEPPYPDDITLVEPDTDSD